MDEHLKLMSNVINIQNGYFDISLSQRKLCFNVSTRDVEIFIFVNMADSTYTQFYTEVARDALTPPPPPPPTHR